MRTFMSNHLLRLSELYEVTAVADFCMEDLSDPWLPGVHLKSIHIVRQIDLWNDIKALALLLIFFRHQRFDVVHSVTPKASLLAMTAARLVGIPYRIQNLSGQVWATRRGFNRFILKYADRFTASNATHMLSDSLSQINFLESEKVVRTGWVEMLGHGSISGVDIERFRPDLDKRKIIRDKLGVPNTALLLLFVGRLNRDKGALELAKAFSQLSYYREDVWLAVVGTDEAGIGSDFDKLCGKSVSRVRRLGYTEFPEHYMAAADILILPSYRESFGITLIEAAACGIPAIASRIYGITDAVEENVTGLLHPPGDVTSIVNCLQVLCNDRDLRLKMGKAARIRVEKDFSMDTITAAFIDYYKKLFSP